MTFSFLLFLCLIAFVIHWVLTTENGDRPRFSVEDLYFSCYPLLHA